MSLQFRRGTTDARLTETPKAGEPVFDTSTNKLYVGDGSTAGGRLVSGSGGAGEGALDDLSDVVITTAANGHILQHNGTNFVNVAHAHTLAGLTDTTISSPQDDQILKYTGGAWINATNEGGSGATAITGLTDVTITSAISGNTLQYNGSDWINANVSVALTGLSDATITSAASGNTIQYNGSAWVNRTHLNVPFMISSTTGIHQPDSAGTIRGDRVDTNIRDTSIRPTLTFMSDDGYISDLNVIAPWALASGIPWVFAWPTNTLDAGGSYLNWTQALAIYNSGFEVASHGMSNDDYREKNVTGLEYEFGESKARFTASGIDTPTFVIPQHYTNELVQRVGSQYYRAIRGIGITVSAQVYNRGVHSSYALISSGIENVEQAQVDIVKAAIDLMVANSGDNPWLILYTHNVDASATSGLDAIVAYANTNDVDILGMSDALNKHETVMYGGCMQYGRGFGFSPMGHLRANTTAIVEEIQIYQPFYPFDKHCRLFYDNGHLNLTAIGGTSYDVKISDVGCIRPAVTNTIDCGEFDWGWKSVTSYAYQMRTTRGDYLTRKSYSVGGVNMTPDYVVVNANIPAGVRLLGATVKIGTAVAGASEWSVYYSGGCDAPIYSGSTVAAASTFTKMYDPSEDSSNRVITDAETDLLVRATDCTAGTLTLVVYYEQLSW